MSLGKRPRSLEWVRTKELRAGKDQTVSKSKTTGNLLGGGDGEEFTVKRSTTSGPGK